MDINLDAPVLTRDEILIDAPLSVIWQIHTNISAWPRWLPLVPNARLDGNLEVGSVFHWEEGGMQIESTLQEIVPPRRLVWSGSSQHINAIHVWEFTQTEHGVLVHSEESWDGAPALAQAAVLQPLLDAGTRTWLTHLKRAAEEA
jgi:uncharacterized protein YndB with AHSA1/START domain